MAHPFVDAGARAAGGRSMIGTSDIDEVKHARVPVRAA